MRVTRVFKRLLGLGAGVRVVAVDVVGEGPAGRMVVRVALPAGRRLVCGRCGQLAGGVYDHRVRAWRDLDWARTRVWVACRVARVVCGDCGVVSEMVAWARAGARFTRRFEDTCAWLLREASQRAVSLLLRVDWETVGRIVGRVLAEQRRRYGDGLDGLRRIGIDEVGYRRGHHYLTVVVCHDTRRVVWAGEGHTAAALARFFAQLGQQRAAWLEAVSLDLSPRYQQAVRRYAPQAAICADPYHIAEKALFALDRLRARHWQQLRRADPDAARWLKDTRYLLRRRPDQRTAADHGLLDQLADTNRPVYHATLWCDQLRALLRDGHPDTALPLLDALAAEAPQLGHPRFTRLAGTLTRHAQQIENTLRYRITNGRVEALNSTIRLISHRARGYQRVDHLVSHIHLICGRTHISLPT